MLRYRIKTKTRLLASAESGLTLAETLVALAVLGAIAVTFISGLLAMCKASYIVDEQTTAESLAQSQIEWVKSLDYVYGATQYPSAPLPSGGDYTHYSTTITAQALQNPDAGIQKITVVVSHSNRGVITLEGYKIDR